MSKEKKPISPNLAEVVKVVGLTAAATLISNAINLRAYAFPVRFSGAQPNGAKTEFYADLDTRKGVFTQTKSANQAINVPPASPSYRYPNGFVDNLVQIVPPPFTRITKNRDFESTENLPVINNVGDIPADQRYIPSPDGLGYQLLSPDGKNALPGAEVFKGKFDPNTNQFRILARTKVLISGTDSQKGTIFFQMPR
jgi:hypothetical protein